MGTGPCIPKSYISGCLQLNAASLPVARLRGDDLPSHYLDGSTPIETGSYKPDMSISRISVRRWLDHCCNKVSFREAKKRGLPPCRRTSFSGGFTRPARRQPGVVSQRQLGFMPVGMAQRSLGESATLGGLLVPLVSRRKLRMDLGEVASRR